MAYVIMLVKKLLNKIRSIGNHFYCQNQFYFVCMRIKYVLITIIILREYSILHINRPENKTEEKTKNKYTKRIKYYFCDNVVQF